MKKIFLLMLVAVTMLLSSNSYALDTFWQNGVALDNVGQIVDNVTLNVRVTIYDAGGNQLYQQTFGGVETSQFAVFQVEVDGSGTGNFANINADAGTMIKVETNYNAAGWVLSSMQSMSYAQYNTTVVPGQIGLTEDHIIIGDVDDNGEDVAVGGVLTASNDGSGTAVFAINHDQSLQVVNDILGINHGYENHWTADQYFENIYPEDDNTWDLGNSRARWRDLWLGGSYGQEGPFTIHIGELANEATIEYDLETSELVLTSPHAIVLNADRTLATNDFYVGNDLYVNNNTLLGGTLGVTGITHLSSDLAVDGNAGVAGDLNLLGDFFFDTGQHVDKIVTVINNNDNTALPTEGAVYNLTTTMKGYPYITVGNVSDLTAERAIATDATLTGTDGGGNGSYTLGIDLTNPNSWTGTQTFADVAVTGHVLSDLLPDNSTGRNLGGPGADTWTNIFGVTGYFAHIQVSGSSTLGDQLIDNVYLNGTVSSSLGDIIVNDNIVPTGTHDLGTSGSPWDNVYANTFHGAMANDLTDGNGIADFTYNGSSAASVTVDYDATLGMTGSTPNGVLGINLVHSNTWLVDQTFENILPRVNNLFDLGSDALRWGDLWVSGASVHIGSGVATEMLLGYASNTGTITINGAANPAVNITNTGFIGFDTDIDGVNNFQFYSNRLQMSTGVGADLYLDESGLRRLGAGPEPFTFETTGGGALNISLANGGALNVTGNTTLGDANTDNVVFNADVNSNIIPNTTATYDLGSASAVWDNVWANTFHGAMANDLTDGNGIADFTYNGSAAATVAVELNGTTLLNGASGISLNLGNANTWSGQQIFGTANPQTPLAPVAGNDLTNKTYVDGAVSTLAAEPFITFTADGGSLTNNRVFGDGNATTFQTNSGDGASAFINISVDGSTVDINSSSQLYVPTGGITSNEIADATIVDADVSGTAEIAVSKLANGTAGQILTTDGTDVSWNDVTTVAWGLTGNAGTTAGTNFIGTTDNVPFEMRVANGGTTENQLFLGANNEIYRENPNISGWVAGNPRGLAAVDLQGFRDDATKVAHGDYSTVGGGQNNTASGGYSTVSGGDGNAASGVVSTVSGGDGNEASKVAGTVSGGAYNTASGDYSTVSGGDGNEASGDYSTVDGGYGNTAQSYGETVAGLFATVGSGTADSYVATDRLFVIGNGTDASNRSNALVMLKNGNTTLNGDLTANTFHGAMANALTDGNGIASFSYDGSAAATVAVELNGTTLSNGASGISLNLGNANTWTATQTFAGIDATSIGATTPGTGVFTTLTATTSNLGTVASGTWNGTAITDTYVADALTIDGGTVTNSTVTPGTGHVTADYFVGSGSTSNAVDLATAEVNGTLPIVNGGTGATTAGGAINNLLPTQTGNSGKFLTTDGTNPSWADEADGVIGNEVTNATDATLVRSGAGTSGDPYTLAINLGNANTWTGTQTFSTAVINSGSIDNTPIGGTTPSTGVFTDLSVANNVITSLIPDATARNLGSNANRWGSLYLTGASIHMGSPANETVIGYNGANMTMDKTIYLDNGTGNWLVYEGTADAFETTIGFTDPVADHTITFPAMSGTILLDNTSVTTGDVQGAYNGGFTIQPSSVNSSKIADGAIMNQDVNSGAEIAVSKLANGTAGQILTTDGTDVSWGSEADGVIGNEVTNATDATLVRSGAGTSGDPYTLAINLGNANTWTGTQTFNTAVINSGSIDNTPIGGTTPSTGAFTTLSTTSNATVGGNANVTGNATVTGDFTANGITVGGIQAVTGGATTVTETIIQLGTMTANVTLNAGTAGQIVYVIGGTGGTYTFEGITFTDGATFVYSGSAWVAVSIN